MNLNRTCVLGSLLIGAILFGGSEADADVIYAYTGNNFDVIFPGGPLSAYTTNMNVSGFFTLSSPLAANVISFITPLSFSFSDGLNTITNTSPNPFSDFALTTDALGNISVWFVFVHTQVGQSVFEIISSSDSSALFFFDEASIRVAGGLTDEAIAQLAPGKWSVTTTPEVPLPAALPLFATGLGALGLLGWRRKKKAATLVA